MKQLFSQHQDTAYALMRIVAGFLFFCHGAQKALRSHGREPT